MALERMNAGIGYQPSKAEQEELARIERESTAQTQKEANTIPNKLPLIHPIELAGIATVTGLALMFYALVIKNN